MSGYKSTEPHEKLNCSFNRMRKCNLTKTYYIYKYTVLIKQLTHTKFSRRFCKPIELNKKLNEQFSACV